MSGLRVLKRPAVVKKSKSITSTLTGELQEMSICFPEEKPPKTKKDALIKAIHDTIESIPYEAAPAAGVLLHPAALTSIDGSGFPSTRTVIPTYIAQDLSEVRIPSQTGTRKEAEITANPRVSLHFQDQRGRGGWVTLKGMADLQKTDNGEEMHIILRPERCEMMSFVEGAMADDDGWQPAILVKLPGGEGWRRSQ